ncbi:MULTISPECIES: hypothetical protein [Novosphingobium]|uniref:hypothetical protein n=1 Tax=Novosphingobium TaxID=165696 RepID=UPI000D312F30|nr:MULTISPECIES: hypothetical protein [Novosphingobium]PTR07856.1 hypothetical protein C8K11_11367 [Novosphingobium sp. GV055]PUB00669.1 hypothetical protein C8K12_11367 [Novosphingobium sp. GV061]PUB16078.1 hypothetical protein C8K14_11367 [Novosphingobium sp. GV079]PUB39543.1 hypothetical protein C8K10_11367 [Novosphingobium sp. GV027]WQD93788.1 hypothetical protein U0041_04095 [Novosphingobium capsulatum]
MNPSEIHRDLGRMEGRLDAVEDRLTKIEVVLERIDRRMARIEETEAKRKGGWAVLVTVASLIASFVAAMFGLLVSHFLK